MAKVYLLILMAIGLLNQDAKSSNINPIRFDKSGVIFNWDNSKSEIVNDVLYKKLVVRFKNDKSYLIEQISNITKTSAIACGKKEALVIGDLAFLLLDKIKGLPFFAVTGFQCDSFKPGCAYPVGYFEIIKAHRLEIAEKVKNYLLTR
jgi:hypothetical protein